MDLSKIQKAIRDNGVDGWLFYDFHHRDPLAYRILGLDPKKFVTRRWYYFIPASGEPKKLVHSIERSMLDSLPGEKKIYLPWEEQHRLLKEILGDAKRIAMQYSPLNSIPYISLVDAGTVELVKSFGKEVVSSADLVQLFEAVVSPEGLNSHREAGRKIHKIMDESFAEIGRLIRKGEEFTEVDIQEFILEKFKQEGLTSDGDKPIVAVNEHASDPHFEPTPENTAKIKQGDFVLLDIWARLDRDDSIYYDITWTGYVGEEIPKKQQEIFEIVRDARDRAVEFVKEKIEKREEVKGYEVDIACRSYIEEKGYGKYFTHRTGHCIGREVHGNGVNIDNLECKDERKLMPGIIFSVEPGIYLPEFGVRSEIDVTITHDMKVEVTGPKQEEIVKIL